MYFPKEFDTTRAIELGGLVQQAYVQLKAFQEDKAWKLKGNYSLVNELKYLWPQVSAIKGANQFDKELRAIAKSRLQRVQGLPIGFIAEDAGEIFLIFRGTMTPNEWLRDLHIRLTAYPYFESSKVHEGFLQTYNVFRATIIESLEALDARKGLFIAGHSLGSALATLAAQDLAVSTGFCAPVIYTFASPRVGDRSFAESYNRQHGRRSFRIANTSDLIVSMPLPVPFLGFLGGYFTHVETPIDFTVQKEDLEKNHVMETYLTALKKNRGSRGFLKNLFR